MPHWHSLSKQNRTISWNRVNHEKSVWSPLGSAILESSINCWLFWGFEACVSRTGYSEEEHTQSHFPYLTVIWRRSALPSLPLFFVSLLLRSFLHPALLSRKESSGTSKEQKRWFGLVWFFLESNLSIHGSGTQIQDSPHTKFQWGDSFMSSCIRTKRVMK